MNNNIENQNNVQPLDQQNTNEEPEYPLCSKMLAILGVLSYIGGFFMGIYWTDAMGFGGFLAGVASGLLCGSILYGLSTIINRLTDLCNKK